METKEQIFPENHKNKPHAEFNLDGPSSKATGEEDKVKEQMERGENPDQPQK